MGKVSGADFMVKNWYTDRKSAEKHIENTKDKDMVIVTLSGEFVGEE